MIDIDTLGPQVETGAPALAEPAPPRHEDLAAQYLSAGNREMATRSSGRPLSLAFFRAI
jgi:hypothetical protein